MGKGFMSLRNQLECRMEYLKRFGKMALKKSARRRLSIDEESRMPEKVVRDGYGCVDFLPAVSGEIENDGKLEESKKWLQEHFLTSEWDEGRVTSQIAATYCLQCNDIVGPYPLTTQDIVKHWPFLFHTRWLMQHLRRLLGISVLEELVKNIDRKQEVMVNFLREKSVTSKRLREYIKAQTAESPEIDPASIVFLLMSYFGEEQTVFFRKVSDITNNEEIEACPEKPQTPYIVFKGERFASSSVYVLVVDKKIVNDTIATPMAAVAVLFGIYFVLNLAYPAGAGATL